MEITCFLDSSTQNDAESSGNYVEKPIWDPKGEKLDEKSEFGHVQQDHELFGHVPKAPNEGESLQKNNVFCTCVFIVFV